MLAGSDALERGVIVMRGDSAGSGERGDALGPSGDGVNMRGDGETERGEERRRGEGDDQRGELDSRRGSGREPGGSTSYSPPSMSI